VRPWVAAAVACALLVIVFPLVAHAAPDEFEEARKGGWLWTYLAVFGAGFLTSLTPCVYPMIPIVMGIFGARGERVSRGRAVLLATAYVGGMGVMYSALGVGVALAGGQFGTFLANPWVVIPMVAFYVALAMSMFGFFELNLPGGLQQRLSTVGGKGFGGAFAMGLVGGLTAAPCTGPMLLGLLTYVGTTGNVAAGFSLLFTFAVGMGVLFFVIAVFAVGLPKSGRWMEWVKSIAGIALLVMAVYFLRPVVPALQTLVDPSVIFVAGALGIAALGLLLGAVHLSFYGAPAEKARKAVGILVTVAGAAAVLLWVLTPKLKPGWRERCDAVVAAVTKGDKPGDPAAETASDAPKGRLPAIPHCWTDAQVVLAEARSAGKPVVIDFGATWCLPCKKYETDVFANPEVHAAIEDGFVAIKFDVTKGTDEDMAAQEAWGAQTLPTVIIIDGEGREVKRFGEPIPTPEEFLSALRSAR
jgi:thiol:disulfide interchange protein DsbD